jgi:hypothetical protein
MMHRRGEALDPTSPLSGSFRATSTGPQRRPRAALVAAGAPLYTRGSQIVRPIVEEVQATRGFKTKVARARPVTVDCLVDYMSRVAQFTGSSVARRRVDEIIAIDNCNDELGGDFLCQLVERPAATGRILGGTTLTICAASRAGQPSSLKRVVGVPAGRVPLHLIYFLTVFTRRGE